MLNIESVHERKIKRAHEIFYTTVDLVSSSYLFKNIHIFQLTYNLNNYVSIFVPFSHPKELIDFKHFSSIRRCRKVTNEKKLDL